MSEIKDFLFADRPICETILIIVFLFLNFKSIENLRLLQNVSFIKSIIYCNFFTFS